MIPPWLALLLTSAQGLAQQAPPPPQAASGSGAVILQLHDPKGNLKGPPKVSLGALEDQEFLPVDDGSGADPHANDLVYSVALTGWDGSSTTFIVTDGDTTWKARGKHEGGTWIWVRVHNERTMQIGEGTPEMTGPEGEGILSRGSGPEGPALGSVSPIGPVSDTVWAVTASLWGLVGVALAAGLGLGIAAFARARPRPAPLRGAAPPPVPPRRVSPAELDPTLRELGPRRLVVVGPRPVDLPDGIEPFEVAEGSLPEEILAALQELALTEGRPLALLVTEVEAMDRPAGQPSMERLVNLLGNRVPLVLCEPARTDAAPEA